jgi:hypothetical protein
MKIREITRPSVQPLRGEAEREVSSARLAGGDSMSITEVHALSGEQNAQYLRSMEESLKEYNKVVPHALRAGESDWDVGAEAVIAGGFGFILDVRAYGGPGHAPPPDKTFQFSGKGGGLFLGGGTAYGQFWCFLPRNQLPGASGFTVEVTPATITIQFYRDGIGVIGHFVGAGIGVAVGGGGGSGDFTLPQVN